MNTNFPSPRASRPLPADMFGFGSKKYRPAVHVERAAFVMARCALLARSSRSPESFAKACEELWPDDAVTPLLLRRAATVFSHDGGRNDPLGLQRGAVTPTSTSNAPALAIQAVGDFMATLAPHSAAAALMADAPLKPSLAGVGSVLLPKRQAAFPATDVAWVGEGAPIPARRFTLTGVPFGPTNKLAAICALTHEIVNGADGEAVVGALLREDVGASLDGAMFSTAAATSISPAGLLNSVTAIPATANGDTEAMYSDLENLASSIATAGGSGQIVYVMAPQQAASARLRLGSTHPVTIYATAALAAKTVVAVDPLGLAAYVDPEPRIEASMQALVHMEDTTPGAVSVVGSPNTVAAPLRSAFQTDSIVLRVIMDVAYAMRGAGLVAVVTGATWG